jgi:hypothetical protein
LRCIGGRVEAKRLAGAPGVEIEDFTPVAGIEPGNPRSLSGNTDILAHRCGL